MGRSRYSARKHQQAQLHAPVLWRRSAGASQPSKIIRPSLNSVDLHLFPEFLRLWAVRAVKHHMDVHDVGVEGGGETTSDRTLTAILAALNRIEKLLQQQQQQQQQQQISDPSAKTASQSKTNNTTEFENGASTDPTGDENRQDDGDVGHPASSNSLISTRKKRSPDPVISTITDLPDFTTTVGAGTRIPRSKLFELRFSQAYLETLETAQADRILHDELKPYFDALVGTNMTLWARKKLLKINIIDFRLDDNYFNDLDRSRPQLRKFTSKT